MSHRPGPGADLTRARLRGATLADADLSGATLTGAFLAQADLSRANLERVNAGGADLSHASLEGASLGEARLADALLEEARLHSASLRFADLTGAVLEGADLTEADLWGAKLGKADFSGATLVRARLGEASAADTDFSRADLSAADLTGTALSRARFRDADLRGATLTGADLTGADLAGARLEELDLTRTTLSGTCWARARLERTLMDVEQLGAAVGEELARDWDGAGRAYTALERNFLSLGEVESAAWAYRRKRRMQKAAAWHRARAALRARRPLLALTEGARYAGDQLVEAVCDYGESVPRVLGALVAVYLLFMTLYGVTGSVTRLVGPTRVVSHRLVDLAIFSLMAMTTSGTPSGDLMPTDTTTLLLSGTQALLGIFLTGLLGFVAGTRIRR